MGLINMEYGAVASSASVNSNFQYLDEKIDSVSQSLSANVTTINNNASLLSTTVANNKTQADKLISELQGDVEELSTKIFVEKSYHSGQSWYRLYSDGWIEQGGYAKLSGSNASNTVTLLKTMADTNYSVIASPIKASVSGDKDVGAVGAVPLSATQLKIVGGRDGVGGVYWRVSGFVSA